MHGEPGFERIRFESIDRVIPKNCTLFTDCGDQRNYLAFMRQHADNAGADPLRLALMLNNLGGVTQRCVSCKRICWNTSPTADLAATCASSACLWDSLRAHSIRKASQYPSVSSIRKASQYPFFFNSFFSFRTLFF